MDWYAIYPKKIDKRAAFKKWSVVIKEATVEDLMAGVRRYAISRKGQDSKFTCSPVVWLNKGKWEDETTVQDVSPYQFDNVLTKENIYG